MNDKFLLQGQLRWRLPSRPLLIPLVALVLAILACGQGEGQEPLGSGGCSDAITFVADVTVPEGTTFAPGEAFTKTWRVRNSGTCDWAGYQATFADGEPMGTMAQAIPDTSAGGEVEVSVEMTAPGGAGGYIGRWQIESPDGTVLGHLTCSILVEEAAGESPGEPSGGGAASGGGGETGGGGARPTLTITNVVVSDSTPASSDWVTITFLVTNEGDTPAENFDIVVISDYSPSGPNNPLEPSRIELLYPDMSADFEYQVFYGVAGSYTIRILATYDWYETGNAEPGDGEAAADVSVTVED